MIPLSLMIIITTYLIDLCMLLIHSFDISGLSLVEYAVLLCLIEGPDHLREHCVVSCDLVIDDGFRKQLERLVELHQLAPVQHQDQICELHRCLQSVRDHQHRRVPVGTEKVLKYSLLSLGVYL